LFDQGMFVQKLFLSLASEIQYKFISMIGQLVLGVIDGVLEIQAEHDCGNNASEDMPST